MMEPVLRGINLSVAALALALCLPAGWSKADETMVLGVQTHFSQRWPGKVWDLAKELGVPVRDAVPWSAVEFEPGKYRIPRHLRGFLENLKRDGQSAVLVFAHPHPDYAAAGQEAAARAQADFIAMLLRDYGEQIRAVEIGNEINGLTSDEDHIQIHLEQLRAAHASVKAVDPDMPVLGGAVLSVAIRFLEEFIAEGGGRYIDGVALHPFRLKPEHLQFELRRLHEMMAGYGVSIPIYATEFGAELDDPEDAPDYLIKMIAILSSSGVREAFWYALIDQAHFKNMGLFTTSGEEKPAARAYRHAKRLLDGHGNFLRQESDPLLRQYATEDGRAHILWGAGQGVMLAEGSIAYAPDGQVILAPDRLSANPFVVIGDAPSITPTDVVGDSLLQHASAPWSYALVKANGRRETLKTIDWEWSSYLGTRRSKPFAVSPSEVVLSGTPKALNSLREELALEDGGSFIVSGEWEMNGTDSDGVQLRIFADDTLVLDQTVSGTFSLEGLEVSASEKIAFELAPGATSKGDRVLRYIQVRKKGP